MAIDQRYSIVTLQDYLLINGHRGGYASHYYRKRGMEGEVVIRNKADILFIIIGPCIMAAVNYND